MNTFAPVAHEFEAFRALPADVPLRIRTAILEQLAPQVDPLFLDLGAGTGRIGEVFIANNDRYVGVDLSGEMLRHFGAKQKQNARLVQADGRRLPLADHAFDAVLLVHVVSNVPGWRRLVDESRRVLIKNGSLIVGQVTRPADGLDARMNRQLDTIAEALGMPPRRSKTQKQSAGLELEATARAFGKHVAATWQSARSPAQFLERKPTGGRFAALAPELREHALQQLSEWAISEFGDIDISVAEEHAFVIDIYRF